MFTILYAAELCLYTFISDISQDLILFWCKFSFYMYLSYGKNWGICHIFNTYKIFSYISVIKLEEYNTLHKYKL